jgi:acetyl esterase/lipase
MFRSLAFALFCAALLTSCGEPSSGQPADGGTIPLVMGWEELTGRSLPAPDRTVRYADHEAGVADLWLPEGMGPHPSVLMIHGGCWQKSIADRTLMNYVADDLRRHGVAVFNIEYRGVDEEGGGYPGTFADVAAAEEYLLAHAGDLKIDPARIVGFGHSAGGHLIAWLSARHNLPRDHELSPGRPAPLLAAVISGGLADLVASEPLTLPSCLSAVRSSLIDEERPDPYADTSPARLQPAGPMQISVHSDRDKIAPPLLGEGFTRLVQDAGGAARYIEVPGGHVELIAPGTEAWKVQRELIIDILNE